MGVGGVMDAFQRVPALAATAAHIVTVQAKLDHLHRVRDESWTQLLTAAARAYQAGDLDVTDLGDLLREMKGSYGTGFTKLWNRNMPISHTLVPHRIAQEARNQPNGPMGTWVGDWPLIPDQPRPYDGVCVVYVLYDDRNEPVYVGSTETFTTRMKVHRDDPKKQCIARWMAYRCKDREEAYLLEEKLLREHMPRLNKRRSR